MLRKSPVFMGLILASLMLSGCAMWPYKERYVIAVRPASRTDTNVTERLIQSDTGIASWAMLKPCYAGPEVDTAPIHRSYFIRSKFGRRTDLKGLAFLKKTHDPDWTGKVSLWSGYGWKVRPVMGTNLWVALTENDSLKNSRGARVYVFDPRGIIFQRDLTGLEWGLESFRFDVNNQEITYRTERGFESYSLLRDLLKKAER